MAFYIVYLELQKINYIFAKILILWTIKFVQNVVENFQ